jgi:hypothetical protein
MKLLTSPRLLNNASPHAHPSVRVALIVAVSALLATSSFAQRPTISVSVSPSTVTNQGEDATITLTASSPPARRLFINFFVIGTAVFGRDYVLVAPNNTPPIIRTVPQIVFPAGQSSVDVILHTMEDNGGAPSETATFFLEPGRRYHVGHPSRATVTIENFKFK